MCPFELLIGVKMRCPEELHVKEVVEEEIAMQFNEERTKLRDAAKLQISKVQQENRRTFNKKRKKARTYRVGDIVAIKRTQFNPGGKLQLKFLGPYEIIEVKDHERYDVRKIGQTEGPLLTSTSAEHLKIYYDGMSSDESSEEVCNEARSSGPDDL